MPMPLCSTELLTIAGADSTTFAQAQFTSDVRALAPMRWQWSAWLDAQGRARHFFLLMRVEPDRLIAWLPLGGAAPMREALMRFVFRAKVTLGVSDGWALHASDTDEIVAPTASQEVVAQADGFALRQPGGDRIAWLAPSRETAIDTDALTRWRRHDIVAGLPLLAPSLAGEFVPQALDLERLDAIRFDKGCYPGQEVAARLHFRGGNKRGLRRLRVDGAAPDDGADVVDADGANVGRILYSAAVSAYASEALAVIADSKIENGTLATLSGIRLSVLVDQTID